ncbi:MAG: sporulation protein [Oscillospiraceae bacterium]|jgi:sporulation protein YqfC|nr:sporulation protein [Oscillospiraceae bacterium]
MPSGPEARAPKQKLWERTANLLDLPVDVVAGLPRVEILGCRRLLMENHRGILAYGGEAIDINGGQVVVRVRGQQLELRAMNAVELALDGVIRSVEFVF